MLERQSGSNRPTIAPVSLKHRIFRDFCWAHLDYELQERHFVTAAQRLRCEVEAIQAVALTEEASGQIWGQYSRPLVLFERHYFARLTAGAYNKSHPDISNWTPRGYSSRSSQYSRLRRAAELDETAALKSASWGMFQIMGENHVAAGFANVQAMVDAMLARASAHLEAFVSYILFHDYLVSAIQDKRWTDFARRYNGPGFAANDYDGKMARHYKRLVGARS